MFDLLFDLVPDEAGEYIGFGLATSATYLYVDHLNSQTKTEGQKVEELKARLNDLTSTMEQNTLTPEAIAYIRSQGKG